MKRIAFLVIITCILMGVGGCMNENANPMEIAQEHLQNKYHEDFRAISYIAKSIDVHYHEVKCENAQGDAVTVFVEEQDGIQIVTDNYYGTLIAPEYKTLLRGFFDGYLPAYKHYFTFTASYFDNAFTADTVFSLETIRNNEMFFSRNYLYIPESAAAELRAEDCQKLLAQLQDSGVHLRLLVYIVPDDLYEQMDESADRKNYLNNEYTQNPLFNEMTTVG